MTAPSVTIFNLPADIWQNCILPLLDRASLTVLKTVCSGFRNKIKLATDDIAEWEILKDLFSFGSTGTIIWFEEVLNYPACEAGMLGLNLEYSVKGLNCRSAANAIAHLSKLAEPTSLKHLQQI